MPDQLSYFPSAEPMEDYLPFKVAEKKKDVEEYIERLREFGTELLDVVSAWNSLCKKDRRSTAHDTLEAKITHPSQPYGGKKSTRSQDPGEMKRVALGLRHADDLVPLLKEEFQFDSQGYFEKCDKYWSGTVPTETTWHYNAMIDTFGSLPGTKPEPYYTTVASFPWEDPDAPTMWDPRFDKYFTDLEEEVRKKWGLPPRSSSAVASQTTSYAQDQQPSEGDSPGGEWS